MTDDLRDIDPETVQAILDNADAFLDIDARVEEIVASGERELASLRENIPSSGGSLENFRKAANEVEVRVAAQLKKLEHDVSARHEAPPAH